MRGSAGMSSGAGFQRTQRQQLQKQETNSAGTQVQLQQHTQQTGAAASAPALAVAASSISSAVPPSASVAPPSRGTQTSLLAATPTSVVSSSVASAPAPPQQQLPSSHALSRHVAACDDDLSPSADGDDDEDTTAADGYFISAEEVAATQKLQAAHEARGEEIAELQSQLRDKQKQLERLQASIARLEKEQTDDNASNFATAEQLRSDLSHEIQKHSATKVQLAQRGNDLASLVRERDLLSTSLKAHELELSSTHAVVRSLRDRIVVLEEIQKGMERDFKFGEQECVAEEEESKSFLEGEEITDGSAAAAPSASSLIPVLSSSSAPLHLRRSRLHALLLHRTIADRKLARLESELVQQRRENQSHLSAIAEQWGQLERIRAEMTKLQEERDQAEEESKYDRESQKDEASISSPHARFSSDASTASLLLQLHQCHEQIDRLERHNARFLRRFYVRVALWCLAIIVACWIGGAVM